MTIKVGSVVEGVVTGITKFGAFVLLPNGETGLVHISEIADSYVKDINEFLSKEETIKVRVLSADGGGKIGLSVRRASESSFRRNRHRGKKPGYSFEDKLTKFFKESDERQQDLRRNTESKQGSRSV